MVRYSSIETRLHRRKRVSDLLDIQKQAVVRQPVFFFDPTTLRIGLQEPGTGNHSCQSY